jgi:DNA-binding MarR family transcriptional regulator
MTWAEEGYVASADPTTAHADPHPGPDPDSHQDSRQTPEVDHRPLTKSEFEALATFRFGIRRYLRFSEEAVRRHGITPQHYQVLLALKGFPGRDWATVGELAERLQLRHHSVVELVNRAQKQGLVQRAPHPHDWRAVRVELSAEGVQLLEGLSVLHREQLRRMREQLTFPVTFPAWDHRDSPGS